MAERILSDADLRDLKALTELLREYRLAMEAGAIPPPPPYNPDYDLITDLEKGLWPRKGR